MPFPERPPRFFPALILLPLLGLITPTRAQATGPDTEIEPIMLDALEVSADDENSPNYDPTGLGGAEAERYEPPFASELLDEVGFDEISPGDLDSELAAAAASGGDAAEIAAGSERLDLRGFPTPLRRNGFTQAGVPEVLNAERSELIVGSLVSPVGRSAPGGIRNIITPRPRGRVFRQAEVSFSTDGQRRASVRASGVVKPKKAWYQASAGASDREGPQDFSTLTQTTLSTALAVRHSRTTSTLWQFDALDARGNPAPGLPEYREEPDGAIVRPHLPLADFHTYGPNAGTRRQAAALAFQLETQISPELSLSSGTQFFTRSSEQDRFTTGQYVRSAGVFSGIREPTHREEDFGGLTHETDLTRRFSALGAEHKVRVGVEATIARADDENRALTTEDRNLLPADVRFFNPAEPNYFRPAYSPGLYRRIITDRENRLNYAALAADTRSALNRGRTVFTSGLRYDFSGIEVNDRRAGATPPHAEKTAGNLSFHLGVNQRIGARVLLFANTSSAVEPSTRVDSRSGKIQNNESTSGLEFGARVVLLERKLSLSAIAYSYTNTDISRRNPLYNDPVADADQSQPQLVTSGEERFRGFSSQLGWKPAPEWTFTARAGWIDAITVSSPDLPEEEGRPLTRLPSFGAGAGIRHTFGAGRLRGLGVGVNGTHVGGVVQNYTRPDHRRLEYPSYTVIGLNASYTWKLGTGKATSTVSLSLANALDADLLAKVSRVGAERSLAASWRVAF